MEKKQKQTRTSVIKRGIKRTLKTAEYESLVIEIGFDEEVEWSSLSERQQKIDNWNTLLLQDYKQTSDKILSELGLTHKKAYFVNPSENTIKKFKTDIDETDASERLDLDDLDTLG